MSLVKLLKNDRGFSLLEVAIAITVVGILAAVVLKGQSLVKEARLQSVATQIHQYKAAIDMFRDKYQALPGDYNSARENISYALDNGDGDGAVNTEREALGFWQHLKLGGLVSIKESVPKSKLGGTFVPSSHIYGHSGTWVVFSNSSVSEVLSGYFRGVLTPKEANDLMNKLDSKVDGDIVVINGEGCKNVCVDAGQFNFKSEEKSCVVIVKID
ncbi:MAG: type II secretion system GspH family protein [Holosporales bacterium]|jgi:prepilin-type N-terminal cleavage/methylation domain-containing protein|nr:type II secretion system GspH family protein [Holosporales bacterium]